MARSSPAPAAQLTRDELRRVLQAFKRVVELEDAREMLLNELCGRDSSLRAEVEAMLAWDREHRDENG